MSLGMVVALPIGRRLAGGGNTVLAFNLKRVGVMGRGWGWFRRRARRDDPKLPDLNRRTCSHSGSGHPQLGRGHRWGGASPCCCNLAGARSQLYCQTTDGCGCSQRWLNGPNGLHTSTTHHFGTPDIRTWSPLSHGWTHSPRNPPPFFTPADSPTLSPRPPQGWGAHHKAGAWLRCIVYHQLPPQGRGRYPSILTAGTVPERGGTTYRGASWCTWAGGGGGGSWTHGPMVPREGTGHGEDARRPGGRCDRLSIYRPGGESTPNGDAPRP